VLALAFRAGDALLALAARDIVEVLPRVPLRAPSLAPAAVIGLLPFRGTLTPVVDLTLLVAGRPSARQLGTRIIVVRIGSGSGERLIGLQAEQVSELIDCERTIPGLRMSEHGWLGEHVADQAGLPQLVDPAELLPDALRALFTEQADA
jgi:chemotaxis-related protein WspB